MKAKDLRIGNLNIWDGTLQEVDPDQLVSMYYGNIEFEPIPLTEEWLVKFGFVKDKIGKEYYRDDFVIYLPYFFQYKDSILREIKCVHQLQNLYHSLTGEELTIKNN